MSTRSLDDDEALPFTNGISTVKGDLEIDRGPKPNRNEPEDVFRDTGIAGLGGEVRMTPVQTIGFRILVPFAALFVGVVIFVITHYYRIMPAPPDVSDANFASLMANYKMIADSAMDQATKLYDLLVMKALLPLIIAITGAVLGSHFLRRQEGAGAS